jgi:hypothetical protein
VFAILGLAAVAILAIVLVSADDSSGTCSTEDLQLAQQIPPYGGAQLEFFDDPEGPGCATVLEVEGSATEVLDHYRGVLEDEGWDVSVQDTPVEGPEGAAAHELVAHRGESEVTIALESFDGQVSAAIRVDA